MNGHTIIATTPGLRRQPGTASCNQLVTGFLSPCSAPPARNSRRAPVPIKGVRVDALAFVDGRLKAGPGPAPTAWALLSPGTRRGTHPVDLDGGETRGHWLNVQVLRPRGGVCRSGAPLDSAQAGGIGDRLRVDLDPAAGDWVMLRVSDPSEPVDPSATGEPPGPTGASPPPVLRRTRLPGPPSRAVGVDISRSARSSFPPARRARGRACGTGGLATRSSGRRRG
jgi:hypothetical protein